MHILNFHSFVQKWCLISKTSCHYNFQQLLCSLSVKLNHSLPFEQFLIETSFAPQPKFSRTHSEVFPTLPKCPSNTLEAMDLKRLFQGIFLLIFLVQFGFQPAEPQDFFRRKTVSKPVQEGSGWELVYYLN